nr:protein MANNAN SYNTHESIS-RELATED 2-like [Ipomoea batatas]
MDLKKWRWIRDKWWRSADCHHVRNAGLSIHDTTKTSELSLPGGDGPWKGDGMSLKPCWSKPVLEEEDQSQGYLTFSLTNGPEYHISQIADAVVVARYLRATLVLPDVRGSNPGDKRNFGDIYNVENFVKSLDGVVKVATSPPPRLSAKNLAVVKVPSRVSEEDIADTIEPVFREKGNLRLATYFPSVNMKKSSEKKNIDSIACLGMFGTLELQPEVSEVVDLMVERLRTLSRKSSGQFIAVDLRESIMPIDKKAKFLDADASELEKAIDFYICSESDVFVPAISGLFYANVAGKRIASGKTQILVPAEITTSSASMADHISHYVSKKNHFAYSCFC